MIHHHDLSGKVQSHVDYIPRPIAYICLLHKKAAALIEVPQNSPAEAHLAKQRGFDFGQAASVLVDQQISLHAEQHLLYVRGWRVMWMGPELEAHKFVPWLAQSLSAWLRPVELVDKSIGQSLDDAQGMLSILSFLFLLTTQVVAIRGQIFQVSRLLLPFLLRYAFVVIRDQQSRHRFRGQHVELGLRAPGSLLAPPEHMFHQVVVGSGDFVGHDGPNQRRRRQIIRMAVGLSCDAALQVGEYERDCDSEVKPGALPAHFLLYHN